MASWLSSTGATTIRLHCSFSGGKDSTFTLYYLVKEFGIKPLVVQFNHGFMRPTLLKNNERTFRQLGVEVLSFTPNWKVVKRLCSSR